MIAVTQKFITIFAAMFCLGMFVWSYLTFAVKLEKAVKKLKKEKVQTNQSVLVENLINKYL